MLIHVDFCDLSYWDNAVGISQLKKLSQNVIKSQINPERTSYAKQGAEQRGGMSSLHTHVCELGPEWRKASFCEPTSGFVFISG